MQTLTSVNAPTIGVVIINYNYAEFLPDAIESILSQESAPDDILVVDDGSSDNSLQVLDAYRDRVRVLTKANGGQLSGCIAGATELKTDYVYFLDSDDYAAPGLIAQLRRACEDNPVKIQFQLRSVDRNKNAIGAAFPTYTSDYGAREMREDNQITGFYVCPPTSGNLFRRETFTSLRFDLISQRDFVDGPPALAMPYLGEVVSLNTPLAYYRLHGGGHSRWDQPNAALIEREIEWFSERWKDTGRLLALDAPPFANAEPVYVLERRLMLAALNGGSPVLQATLRYLRRLSLAKFSRKQKWMLAAWAVSLLFPSASWRRKQILARRSPLNRSRTLQRVIGLIMKIGNFSASKAAGGRA